MYRKVLVGTDGSKTAAKAVDRAVEVAPRRRARRSTILTAAAPERGADDRRRRGRAPRRLPVSTIDTDGDRRRPGRRRSSRSARGGGYDLLVVGNRGMTGVTRFLRLGSVPNKVTHHLPCSLLIVKTT